MLKPVKSAASSVRQAGGGRFFIVASRYNERYVNAMVRAAQRELRRAAARQIKTIRVPGAYEIPVVVAHLARAGPSEPARDPKKNPGTTSAIICLGVILRGETAHAAHIGEAVSRALMELQVKHTMPIIHEVLLLENEQQARVRCLGKTHNRGTEAARTALAMAQVMERLRKP